MTDVIHLTTCFYVHFWIDLSLSLTSALTGVVLGFASLSVIHLQRAAAALTGVAPDRELPGLN